ncbi:MAG: anthranilate phosphoribosyltransferase [Aphanocapsa feldmannii 288cV]|nr:MAG: anthranilate phosphoribosyltransferase [Aphanocapsa feldmannii 288cV]
MSQPLAAVSWAPLIEQLLAGQPMAPHQSRELMQAWLGGKVDPVQTGALLTALRAKGTTGAELAAMATVLQEATTRPEGLPPHLLDTCGTGGDGADTFNISTAVAFTAAACGARVAKHGNRSASGKVGSADVLEALGLNLGAEPRRCVQALHEVGICFLFAPGWHPGLVGMAPLRRSLGIRTVFNLLGPLVNPMGPAAQVLGVAQVSLLRPMAEALAVMGMARAIVVHGSEGLDEAGLGGEAALIHVEAGAVRPERLDPAAVGVTPAPLSALAGGDTKTNAEILRAVLQGRGTTAQTDAVALNTALALLAAGRVANVADGVSQARDALLCGKPWARLESLVTIVAGG